MKLQHNSYVKKLDSDVWNTVFFDGENFRFRQNLSVISVVNQNVTLRVPNFRLRLMVGIENEI
jgi:hypothetical protein